MTRSAAELRSQAEHDPLTTLTECAKRLQGGADTSLAEAFDLGAAATQAALSMLDLEQASEQLRSLNEAVQGRITELSTVQIVDLVNLTSTVLLGLGRPGAAQSAIATIATSIPRSRSAQLHLVFGVVSSKLRDHDRALEHYRRGLQIARRANATDVEMRLLNNRGVHHLERGSFARAESDFDSARHLASSGTIDIAINDHNRGSLAARRGDLGTAMSLFEKADAEFDDSAAVWAHAPALLDRAQLMLDAGLLEEGAALARDARSIWVNAGAISSALEAAHLEARILAAKGNYTEALAVLRTASTDGQPLAQAQLAAITRLAEMLAVAGAMATGDSAAIPKKLPAVNAHESLELVVDIGLTLAATGRQAEALALLDQIVTSRSSSSALDHLHRSVARAVRATAMSDADGAIALVRKGLRRASETEMLLAVTELRFAAGRRLRQLRDIGLAATDRPQVWWELVERERGISLRPEPGLSPRARSTLAQLRVVSSELGALAGYPQHRQDLLKRRRELERQLHRQRRAEPARKAAKRKDQTHSSPAHPCTTVALAVWRDRVEVLIRRGAQVERLTPIDEKSLNRHARSTRLALAAEASSNASGLSTRPIAALQRLLAPVREALTNDETVQIAADSRLPAIPWPLVVTPAVIQLGPPAVRHKPKPGVKVLACAGPDLRHAKDEVKRIASIWSDSSAQCDTAATTASVLRGMREADVLHIAAHGIYRTDNPLASTIHLCDGIVTFYDLLGVDHVPQTLILSACEVGKYASAHPLGIASVLIERGAQAVIASYDIVSDAVTADLMVDLHTHIASGVPAEQALHLAQTQRLGSHPAVAFFGVFGPA